MAIVDVLRLDLSAPSTLASALADGHPGVRRRALPLAARLLPLFPKELVTPFMRCSDDPDAQVRLELAYVLGGVGDVLRDPAALAQLAQRHAEDPYLVAAVLSSIHRGNVKDFADHVLNDKANSPAALRHTTLGLVAAMGDDGLRLASRAITRPADLGHVLPALGRRGKSLADVVGPDEAPRFAELLEQARQIAERPHSPLPERLAALAALGWDKNLYISDVAILEKLLSAQTPDAVQSAAVTALGRVNEPATADILTRGWRTYAPARQQQVLDVLLSRPAWQRHLIDSIAKKTVPVQQIDAARRQRLFTHKDAVIRKRATELFAGAVDPDRQKVLALYQGATTNLGDPKRGEPLFQKHCAACHRLGSTGHAVGPDLAALTNKSPAYLLSEILDPNKNVDSRYVEYLATTKSGQTFTGVLAAETATSITLRGQEGKQQTLLRADIDELVSTGKSLMPEGLEKELPLKEMTDLLAFLTTGQAQDAGTLARQILDDSLPTAKRQAIINEHPQLAAQLIAALTVDLKADAKEEYRRIPWIWRVAIAAGKRNDAKEIRAILEASLPREGESLRDWQAVVLGGGIINGVSQQGDWPGPRLQKILSDAGLDKRWHTSLAGSFAMVDNEKTPTGTHYDALRMIALARWDKSQPVLAKYLAKGVHAELHMGAVSGLADIDRPEIAPMLLGAWPHLSASNRALAIDALLRTNARVGNLLHAIAAGKVMPTQLSTSQVERLREIGDEALRRRARELLPQRP